MCFEWVNKRIKKLKWYDMSLIKLGSAAFALMVAKLWAPILSLDWYWYLVIVIVVSIKPFYDMFMS